MKQNRKQVHGNTKLGYISGLCKAVNDIYEDTELEYDDETVQTFLKVLAKESIGLLTDKFRAELGIK